MTHPARTTFLEIAKNYDAFLCDLWGVIHDGDALYEGVLESLAALHGMGKKLVFLSNAPRLAESVLTRMDEMGVRREWYAGAMTSGEAAVQWLCSCQRSAISGQRYYYLGLEKDAALLDLIPQQRVKSLAEADFILNGNFEFLGQNYAEIEPLVKEAAQRNLPMLCINPDLEVTKIDGTQILCAGHIAAEYEKRGGMVEYIGKPYSYVLELGMKLLGNPTKNRVLMIGDNALTDIKGGNDFGVDTAFVTQGILQNQNPQQLSAKEFCAGHGVCPTQIITSL